MAVGFVEMKETEVEVAGNKKFSYTVHEVSTHQHFIMVYCFSVSVVKCYMAKTTSGAS